MPATLGYALLALLARRPGTGYELAASLRSPVGYFWTARHSQIYPELQGLHRDGLVDRTSEPGPGPGGRKVYAITPAGLAALRAWVVEPPRPRGERDELALKSYALWVADPAEARELFRAQAAAHEHRLAEYEATHEEVLAAGEPRPGDPRFGNFAVLQLGISYERHRLTWCRWVVDRLTG